MAHPAFPLSLVSAVAAGSPGLRSGANSFVDLDERLIAAQPGQGGVVIVRASEELHIAILAHVARRLRTSGWSPVDARVRLGSPVFLEVATKLRVRVSCDPIACAEAIAQAASAKRAAILVTLPKYGSWDHAVATELARNPRTLLVCVAAEDPPTWDATTYHLAHELAQADKLRWLSAVAEEAHAELPTNDLRTLEAWWTTARRSVPSSSVGAPSSSLGVLDELHARLDDIAREIFTRVALAGRSVPAAVIASGLLTRTRTGEVLRQLIASGTLVQFDTLVALPVGCAYDERALLACATPETLRAAAQALMAPGPGDFEPDPWAWARAAELFVGAGAIAEADEAAMRAVQGADDPQVAEEMTARWYAAVSPLEGDAGVTLRVRAAERALGAGDAADALRWCESAATLRRNDPSIGLLMGRALMQVGDLVAARVALHKAHARTQAGDSELRARIAAELAEVSYVAGELDASVEQANKAIDLAPSAPTLLGARNTLGKILLANAKWDEADEHFADDALSAAAAGVVTAELRARLNRGIALMSKGRLDDARATLERVLEDGARLGEDRARAHALGNLAVIAYRRHEYGDALALWEQTTRFPQALRGRIATARTIANLAELRLRLGLVDHADHAIAFGRRLLGAGTTAARASHFGVVAARIALARGNTDLARREVDAAIVDGEAAGDKDYLGEAHRVAARVALEDGDMSSASVSIRDADALATNERGRAEVAILRALHQRARGESALESATQALAFARTSGEEDLLAEIHALLLLVHRDAGDIETAEVHGSRAVALRDQVAAGLSPDVRAAFLAKPEIVLLARLQASLASLPGVFVDPNDSASAPPSVDMRAESRDGRGAGFGAREIVGSDPQMRSLMLAVRKVARSNSTILIRGESGTGKELIAEALHAASDRAGGPLVSVNCAALVETLLLSELFGHEKGAFTGASNRRRGRFELAEGGTLFLDEIGDISPRTQVALLRVLQEKTFERVGGATSIRANVRIVCATHRDLKAMVERGEFREDLYYRLRGITLEVPALRARLGDLPKITEHLVARIAQERGEEPKTFAPEAIELLLRHRWAGNVRELENVLRAVTLFAEGDVVTASDLVDNIDDLRALAQSGPASQAPVSLRASMVPSSSFAPASASLSSSFSSPAADDEEGQSPLPEDEANATAVAYAQVRQGAVSLSDIKRQIERDCIARALTETKGNITKAASLLGMKRPRLSQLVKQYGLSASSSEGNG